jgi:hypothetical protein
VDLLQDPRRVLSDHILATPTLIKLSPAPVRAERFRESQNGFGRQLL